MCRIDTLGMAPGMLLLLMLLTGSAASADNAGVNGGQGVATLAKEDPAIVAQVEETVRRDAAMEKITVARLARVPALENTSVEVTAGVVTLRGLVDGEANRELAAQLASTIDGVVAVNNQLKFDTAINRRLAPVLADGLDRLKRLILALPLLAVALLIVYCGFLLGRIVTRWNRLFMSFRNPFLAELLRHAVQMAVTAVGVLVALNLLAATAVVSAILGAAGIAGLALGFAFRDLVENYIAGILLSLRQPFAPDDHVIIEGREGRVATLTSRATSLITLDGNHLRLPNALVFKGVILNFSRNPTRMFSFDMQVDNTQRPVSSQRVALSALRHTPGVLPTPTPGVLFKSTTPAGIVMSCSGWVDQQQSNFYAVQSEAIRRVKTALDREGAQSEEARRELAEIEREASASTAQELRGEPVGDVATRDIAAQDVAVGSQIKAQLETERLNLADHNLLRPDAPRE